MNPLVALVGLTLLAAGCSDALEPPTDSWETTERYAEPPEEDPPAPEPQIRRRPPVPEPPPRPTPQALEADVVELINLARAGGADCGEEGVFAPTGPLDGHPALDAAARHHSRDMAQNDFLAHEGTDGSRFWARADHSGYPGRARGENVAGGHPDAEAVVEAWLESDSHCMVLMLDDVDEVGVGYVFRDGTTYGHFWTMVVATRPDR